MSVTCFGVTLPVYAPAAVRDAQPSLYLILAFCHQLAISFILLVLHLVLQDALIHLSQSCVQFSMLVLDCFTSSSRLILFNYCSFRLDFAASSVKSK